MTGLRPLWRVVITWVVAAATLLFLSWVLPGFDVGGAGSALLAALLLGLVTDWSSQTGASQAGILFGSNEDMPAVRWLEKETGTQQFRRWLAALGHTAHADVPQDVRQDVPDQVTTERSS